MLKVFRAVTSVVTPLQRVALSSQRRFFQHTHLDVAFATPTEPITTAAATSALPAASSAICDIERTSDAATDESDQDLVLLNPFSNRIVQGRSAVKFMRKMKEFGFQMTDENSLRYKLPDDDESKLILPPRVVSKSTGWLAMLHNLAEAKSIRAHLEASYSLVDNCQRPARLEALEDPLIEETQLTEDQKYAVAVALQGISLYIGGGAGTGKTVLLKAINRELTRLGVKVAVTATTGIAAVLLGGCTFHHAFRVPLPSRTAPTTATTASGDTSEALLEASSRSMAFSNAGASKQRWDFIALRSIDAIILDEISMLDACTLDELDRQARIARLDQRPFGGIQVIASGDFLQLVPDDEGRSACFMSRAFQKHLHQFQLTTPLRHKENDGLLNVLLSLRVGDLDGATYSKLAKSAADIATVGDRALTHAGDEEHVTYLFPKRSSAQLLNQLRLDHVVGEEVTFTPQRGPIEPIGCFSVCFVVRFLQEQDVAVLTNLAQAALAAEVSVPAAAVAASADPTATQAPVALVVVMPVISSANDYFEYAFRLRYHGPEDALPASTWEKVMTRAFPPSTASPSPICGEGNDGELTPRAKPQVTHMKMYDTIPSCIIPYSVASDLATIGDPQVTCPLQLKVGCRVMVVRNLSRTVINGSIGVLEAFAPLNRSLLPGFADLLRLKNSNASDILRIFPQLPVIRLDSGEVIQVPPVVQVVGGGPETYFYGHDSYSLPLQLGYAFTVHKVQGLTLQGKVELDCREFFDCPHLIYVACSRVKSMEQLRVIGLKPWMVTVQLMALKFAKSLPSAADHPPVSAAAAHRAVWAVKREQALQLEQRADDDAQRVVDGAVQSPIA